jgi:hypothetical protein
MVARQKLIPIPGPPEAEIESDRHVVVEEAARLGFVDDDCDAIVEN